MDQFLMNLGYGSRWTGRTKAGTLSTGKTCGKVLIASRYRHEVTKARHRTLAPETGGGILADEMGMGKSLSTLALITKTLDDAADWVEEKKADPEPHSGLKPCKATLVVVPSASKSFVSTAHKSID